MKVEIKVDDQRPRIMAAKRKFSVIEIFGPTIQGEGPDAGRPCCFVRLGGCDYRCSWCDSPYAVDPQEVREHSERLSAEAIVDRVQALPGEAPIVVLSGGNPALFHLQGLVQKLHEAGFKVSVETQGSVWRPWLERVDRLVISPKPPSSGMAGAKHAAQTAQFMQAALRTQAYRMAVKIVIFNDEDYEWALAFHDDYPHLPFYLSVGTLQMPSGFELESETGARGDRALIEDVCDRYRWLCEKVAGDWRARKAIVLPQMHVLAWGTARGV